MRSKRHVEDTPSETVAELRRSYNSLLLILENISEQVDAATITATEGFVALGLAISNGVDDDVTGINGGANDYTGTGLELLGVVPTVRRPVPRKRSTSVDIGVDEV